MKGALQRIEIESLFLAAKSFNTILVQFLPHTTLLLVECTSALLRAPKTVLHAWNLMHEKL